MNYDIPITYINELYTLLLVFNIVDNYDFFFHYCSIIFNLIFHKNILILEFSPFHKSFDQ